MGGGGEEGTHNARCIEMRCIRSQHVSVATAGEGESSRVAKRACLSNASQVKESERARERILTCTGMGAAAAGVDCSWGLRERARLLLLLLTTDGGGGGSANLFCCCCCVELALAASPLLLLLFFSLLSVSSSNLTQFRGVCCTSSAAAAAAAAASLLLSFSGTSCSGCVAADVDVDACACALASCSIVAAAAAAVSVAECAIVRR